MSFKGRALLEACALARPAEGGCRWCGSPLPKGRRAWCAERCSRDFWTNHWWTLARRAAKRRDRYTCARCGHRPPPRPARGAALRAWKRRRVDERLEVNHLVPCLGAHGELSCSHHLGNLETLCAPCHRALTADQARAIVCTTDDL